MHPKVGIKRQKFNIYMQPFHCWIVEQFEKFPSPCAALNILGKFWLEDASLNLKTGWINEFLLEKDTRKYSTSYRLQLKICMNIRCKTTFDCYSFSLHLLTHLLLWYTCRIASKSLLGMDILSWWNNQNLGNTKSKYRIKARVNSVFWNKLL